MHSFYRIASISLVALLLGTGLASADGKFPDIGGSPNVGINDSVSDAVHHDTSGDIKDAVFDAVKPLNSQEVNDMVLARDGTLLPAGGLIAIDCDVGGADLLVANIGDVAIPAGTRLKWTVATEHARGQVKLLADLSAGAKVRIANALDNTADADAQCNVNPVGF